MDGITDSAFRRLVRGFSRDVIVFSEFTSADGFLRSSKVRQKLHFHPEEHPYFVQLFGNNPGNFREAALALEQLGVAGIDINMGCPARKIVHSQHGSGLMRDVQQACRVVEAVANACQVDVSVKTRLGWRDDSNLPAFAQSLADAGASLLTIHGRTYAQGFSGQADWAPIRQLKSHLRIPVLGNGDISHYEEGLARMGELDGFMIGRASIGNPWVFLPGAKQGQPGLGHRVPVMLRHFQLMREDRPEKRAVLEFRKHLVGYLRGFAEAKRLRKQLLAVTSEKELVRELASLADNRAA